MAFYLEDELPHETGRFSLVTGRNTKSENSLANSGGDIFVCDNCGGRESYLDETSGGLTCLNCFTQSQTTVAASQEDVDYEEAVLLAGRKSGHLAFAASVGQHVKRKTKGLLHDTDTTVPLPKTGDCIRGIQRLLRESTLITAKLVGSTKDETEAALKTTKNVWKSFLRSWMEATNFFGTIYPETRFCFRDYFLSAPLRTKVLKTLALKAAQQVREKLASEGSCGKISTSRSLDSGTEKESAPLSQRGKEIAQRDLPETIDQMTDASSFSSALTTEDVNQAFSQSQHRTGTTTRLILSHCRLTKRRTIGRKMAALSLSPSMTMVASILSIAFSPYGISTSTIQYWIKTGDLPLMNAFHLLTLREQNLLKPVQGFFCMQNPPCLSALYKTIEKLHVACGYRPRKIVLRRSNKKPDRLPMNEFFRAGRLVTPHNLPIFLARIISSLGLSQTVMIYALALTGLPIPSEYLQYPSEGQALLPLPLASCRSERIRDPMGLLALVVVACKHLPAWESYGFQELNPVEKYNAPLFPWNESEHLLSNGHLGSYLARSGAIFMSSEGAAFSAFLSKLDSQPTSRKTKQTESTVRMASTRIFKPRHEFVPRKEAFIHCELNDSNPAFRNSMGFCPFIDFVARKAGANPNAIARLVTEMESDTRMRHYQNDQQNMDYSSEKAFLRRHKLPTRRPS